MLNSNDWWDELASQEALQTLLAPDARQRVAAGYGYTLVEICQQPITWIDTARRVKKASGRLAELLRECQWLAITGSGSSQYAGECVDPVLQAETGLATRTVSGGAILLEGPRSVSNGRPGVLVSLARSGDSPESTGVVELFLASDAQTRHLIMTCNEDGRLTTSFSGNPRAVILALDPQTNDRSLAMTSSFTNMVLAARGLGFLTDMDGYERLLEGLSAIGRQLLLRHTGTLAAVGRGNFQKAVYLASGCRHGAARESALKMLEMTSGRVTTMAETYLGLRHGPMCLVDEETLVVCFLDSRPQPRAYEVDLIAELNEKRLGARKLILGEGVPTELLREGDLAVELPGLATLGDPNAPVIDVMAGQLLAFFRCLEEGLSPDMPSEGVINRVVNEFKIYSDGVQEEVQP